MAPRHRIALLTALLLGGMLCGCTIREITLYKTVVETPSVAATPIGRVGPS